MDNSDIVEKLNKNAKLASAFVKDHPNSNIRTVNDFYHFVKNNPGIVEGWMHNQSGIPFQQRTIQELASSFHAITQLDEAQKFHVNAPQSEKPSPVKMGALGALLAGPLILVPGSEIKLAEVALQEPVPEVNLAQFVPTEIKADEEFQEHLSLAQEQKIAEIKAQNPDKKYSKNDLDELVQQERQSIEKEALERYAITSDKAEKIRTAREKDIYLKDDKGRVIGEKIFTDKKNNPEPYQDPVFKSYQLQKQAAIRAALEKRKEDKKNGIKPKYKEDQLKDIITFQYDGQFAAMFPEKAAAYAKQDWSLDRSLNALKKAEKRLQKKDKKQAKKTQKQKISTTIPLSSSTTTTPVEKQNTEKQSKKTAKTYQQLWNNKTLEKAIKKGYDRTILAHKIRDIKAWRTRKWKEGKEAIRPIARAAQKPFHGFNLQSANIRQQATSGFLRRQFIGGRGGGFWTRQNSPITNSTSLGKRMGGKVAQKIAGKAGKKLAQQLAKKVVIQGATKFFMSPPGLITLGVVLGSILLFVFVLTIISLIRGQGDGGANFAGGPGSPGGPGGPGNNPIPNFTLSKTVSATTLPAPEEITYTISYSNSPSTTATGQTADPKSIIIYDTVPENTALVASKTTGKYTYDTSANTLSWALSDPENSALTSFTFTVIPSATDVIITNKAWATASQSSLPNPGGGAQSPNACTQPYEGTGYCAYSNLLPYFNNDPSTALTASIICNLESGSNPFSTNKKCPDYSIGLFQINLVAHCGGAFDPPPTCTILNQPLVNACETRFLDPAENIKYAYQLYLNGGTGWTANKWSTYPKAQSILSSCGSI